MNLLSMALGMGIANTIAEDEKKKRERNIIEIPDNATNGDVIKAVFPGAKLEESRLLVFMFAQDFDVSLIDRDWWNAPYDKEGEEE